MTTYLWELLKESAFIMLYMSDRGNVPFLLVLYFFFQKNGALFPGNFSVKILINQFSKEVALMIQFYWMIIIAPRSIYSCLIIMTNGIKWLVCKVETVSEFKLFEINLLWNTIQLSNRSSQRALIWSFNHIYADNLHERNLLQVHCWLSLFLIAFSDY